MTAKARSGPAYRHTPAFILLFLAKKDYYGAALLSDLQKELPYFCMDGAVIYRSLQELAREGSVQSYWETDKPGPPRKWYKITAKGLEKLAGFQEDIELRAKNFEYFLAALKEIQSDPKQRR